MREIAVLSFVSLDGVMQGPVQPDEDTSGGFTQSGWSAPYLEEVMTLVNRELMEEPVAFLFGRKTYEMFARHWPNVTGSEHGDLLNRSKKYAVTSTLETAAWQNSELITGDCVEALRHLKAQDGPRLQVHGSAGLIQTLTAHDLVDEFRLFTFPVVLGAGKRLFEGDTAPARLSLSRSQTTKNGVVMSIYRRS
ncbi:dihydrofolate reductase family protein [Nitratireductor sp. XY-223]|uniref:dihydrofolate reductase family protein n=1 Tax=Nitratireductor sp. XY-223 TaxID=2561926 RepID=UPI0010AA8B3E|nr:dihydrofolate reductase family protein [Nitratireductor sp. XY-223]